MAVGDPSNSTNVLLSLPVTGNLSVETWNPGDATKIGEIYTGPGSLVGRWGPNIGNINAITDPTAYIDLSNDHPVSFQTAGLTIPGMKASWQTAPGLRLFGPNQSMECSTCHNVHDNTIPPFLTVTNDKSEMCLACHDK